MQIGFLQGDHDLAVGWKLGNWGHFRVLRTG